MLHKAWNSKGEMPYCFPRSSIKFQGHTGQNITDFDPNWAFLDYRPVAAFKSLRFALLISGSQKKSIKVISDWFLCTRPNTSSVTQQPMDYSRLSLHLRYRASLRLKSTATWQFVQHFVKANNNHICEATHYFPVVRWIYRRPVDSLHKGPVTRKLFTRYAEIHLSLGKRANCVHIQCWF